VVEFGGFGVVRFLRIPGNGLAFTLFLTEIPPPSDWKRLWRELYRELGERFLTTWRRTEDDVARTQRLEDERRITARAYDLPRPGPSG
jgi:hypothetical protein